MEQHAIAWESVNVSRSARGFELAVELSDPPSADWEALFNQAAEQEGLLPQGRGWSHIRVAEGTLTMRELRREARVEARRYLEDLVSRTDAELARRLEEEEHARLRAEQEEAELRRQAEELTDWFRSGGDAERPARPGPTAAPQPETPDPEHGDLRDRLVHAFRSDAA